MKLDLDALEVIARAATPGPWRWTDDDTMVSDVVGHPDDANYDWDTSDYTHRIPPTRIIETDSGHYPPRDNDRAHIATFDPHTVLALIALARKAP